MFPAIGFALRDQDRHVVPHPSIDAVEITIGQSADPVRVQRSWRDLDFRHVSVHASKLSVAGPDQPSCADLNALKATADQIGAQTISDHLGFTRRGDAETRYFAPPPYTMAALDVTCRNVDFVQRSLGSIRFYLENIAYGFRFDGKMSEADFLRSVLNRTGCGWLLDVTNLYANARNFGFDAFEFIEQVLPGAQSVQIHLAGCAFDESRDMYVGRHSLSVPDAVWNLYRHAMEMAGDRVSSVFIERDRDSLTDADWLEEIGVVRKIATQAMRESPQVLSA